MKEKLKGMYISDACFAQHVRMIKTALKKHESSYPRWPSSTKIAFAVVETELPKAVEVARRLPDNQERIVTCLSYAIASSLRLLHGIATEYAKPGKEVESCS